MMKRTTWLAALLVLGCDRAPAKPEAVTAPRGAEAPTTPQDLAARPADRGPVRGGEPVARKVEWPDPAQRDVAALGRLAEASQASVTTSPVPVLVPGADVVLSDHRVMHGPKWMAFWGQGDGFTVSLHGSIEARVIPGVEPVPLGHTVREREGLVTRNEGIWSASWIEHGVAYALELECTSPDAAPCADDTMLLSIADGLVYVGGRGPEVKP